MVGKRQFEKPLDGEAPVEAVEGDEAVYDVGDDPLLDESHQEVGAQNHLQRPSEEEKLAYSVRLREVELVAESGSQHEVEEIPHCQVVWPVHCLPAGGAGRQVSFLLLGFGDVHHCLHSLLPEEISIAVHLGVYEESPPTDNPAPLVDLDVGDELEDDDGVAPTGEDRGDQGAVHGVDDDDGVDQSHGEVHSMEPAPSGPVQDHLGQEFLDDKRVDDGNE